MQRTVLNRRMRMLMTATEVANRFGGAPDDDSLAGQQLMA